MTGRPASPLDAYFRRAAGFHNYLNQGEIWLPRPPREQVRIADMDPAWRFNSAAMLLRNAAGHAERYSWGELSIMFDAPDDVQNDSERWDAERRRDPQRWLRSTTLFRALVRGLPDEFIVLVAVAEQARHYSTCLMRAKPVASTCCNGSGFADYAAVPCPNPECPVPMPRQCTCNAGQIADVAVIESIAATARTVREADERAAAARLAAEQREVQRQALRDWIAANPGIDPATNRPWGVDEDGIDHNEAHSVNDNCHFDSCSACGGYHCGYYCDELGWDGQW